MALYRRHEKSASALVRAGAYIYQTVTKSLAPEEGDEDVWSAFEACRDMYGNKTAFRLEQAANASAAVAGHRTRRKMLRASRRELRAKWQRKYSCYHDEASCSPHEATKTAKQRNLASLSSRKAKGVQCGSPARFSFPSLSILRQPDAVLCSVVDVISRL
jgi:hypothetical protein